MDFSDYPTGKSPRKELQLQGPRPAPLKIHKDSHKIKKPPVVPQPSQANQPHQPPRQPVIIYTVSPKIIHTNPSDFMNLVQRLTGLPPSNSSASCSSSSPRNDHQNTNGGGGESTMEQSRSSDHEGTMDMDDDHDDRVHDTGLKLQQKGMFPGILSPAPGSLPPIPSNFFSPPADSFFHDLSPVLHGNRNFIEGSFMPSPSNFFSPTPSIDLFNNFSDL
ncbi:PREDICTED: protein MKS1 [Fragaria vesca subsp. vesca]|uniref:protein MKS1 n=1 Tax=Fragaria vesca subsp. vesca TaxID=101020 RepID=UPI0002C2FA7B|nr:PREDICTED: protein MKS1 [Fragaria vesca subsp. vesca]